MDPRQNIIIAFICHHVSEKYYYNGKSTGFTQRVRLYSVYNISHLERY